MQYNIHIFSSKTTYVENTDVSLKQKIVINYSHALKTKQIFVCLNLSTKTTNNVNQFYDLILKIKINRSPGIPIK